MDNQTLHNRLLLQKNVEQINGLKVEVKKEETMASIGNPETLQIGSLKASHAFEPVH